MLPPLVTRGRFAPYFWGHLATTMGSAVAPVALAVGILTSGSDANLGVVLACQVVPTIALMLIGGGISDRRSRRNILVSMHVVAGAGQVLTAVVLITDGSVLLLCASQALVGSAIGLSQPALRGLLPSLVQPGDRASANSLMMSARGLSLVVGPPVSSLLVVTVGGGPVLLIDAASFLIAATCFRAIQGELPPARPSSMREDLAQGWEYFARTRWLHLGACALGVTNMTRAGAVSVLGPAIALATFGIRAWGVFVGLRAIGVFVGSFVPARVHFARPMAAAHISLATGGAFILMLGTTDNVLVLGAVALVGGLGSGIYNPLFEGSLQEWTPSDMLSRAASYDGLISTLGVPIGMLLAPALASRVGWDVAAVVAGVLFVAASLLPLVSRQMWRSDPDRIVSGRRETPAPTTPAASPAGKSA